MTTRTSRDEFSEPMVVFRDGVEQRWSIAMPADGSSIVLQSPDGEVWTGEGSNLWESFRALRRKVEPAGVRLCCNGARTDAHPSRMGIEMGGGGGVYLLKLRQPVRSRRQLVDLFGYANPRHIGTIDEQDAFYEHWLGSLR